MTSLGKKEAQLSKMSLFSFGYATLILASLKMLPEMRFKTQNTKEILNM